MKIACYHTIVASLLFPILNFQFSTFAQGSLTPPGPPAPTMLSLSQIEPRTPVDATHTPGNSFEQFIITQPGSYYLTTNINLTSGEAIDIMTNGVTLDLNGFTISSTDPANSGYAIRLGVPGGNSDVTILNGHIKGGVTNSGTTFSGPGFGSAISTPGTFVQNVHISNVSISGCAYYGINLNLNDSIVVESCTIQNIGVYGIFAGSVSHCTVFHCVSGIDASTATDCTAQTVGSGTAIFATTAHNCYGYCAGDGVGVHANAAENCYGFSTNGDGIYVANSAHNCTGGSALGIGIYGGDGAVLVGCSVYGGATGFSGSSHCTLKNCNSFNNSTNGIVGGPSWVISGCNVGYIGFSAAGIGISTGNRSLIENCVVNDCQNDGILAAGGGCIVLNNLASHNGLGGAGSGIHTTSFGNRIDGNQTRDNASYGIRSDGGLNADVITRNTAGANTSGNFTPATGFTFAPVQYPATSTNAMANISF